LSVSPRQISRVLNLSFKVTGLKEQSEGLNQFIMLINDTLRSIMILTIAVHGLNLLLSTPTNPIGLLMLGMSALSTISLAQNLLTQSDVGR
jgi:hypothetical protein